MAKLIDGHLYYTIGEVARAVRRSVQTIKNWYEWDELQPTPKLPVCHRHLDAKRTRYFRLTDIAAIEAFRNTIKYGDMAEVSRTKWGKRKKD